MIPREIYTLGAVQLNTQPLAALQGQLLAKKAARDEAFNKWQADLAKQINLEGVRQKDLLEPQTGLGIQKDIEAWERYYDELEEYNRMFMDVSFSNEEWASNIRRLVYKFD